MALQWTQPTIDEIDPENMFYNVLVYGVERTYKTRFAATWPNPLFFDFDNGLKSCLDMPPKRITYSDKPSEWDKFERDLASLRVNNPDNFKTLVIDSVTTMSDLLLRRILQDTGKPNPTRDEYGRRVKIIKNLISSLMAGKNFNFILIAHEDTVQDDNGNVIKIIPYMPGTGSGVYFDEIYHAQIQLITQSGEAKPIFQSQPSRLYLRGSRLHVGDIKEPTYNCFIKHVKEGIDRTKQLLQTKTNQQTNTEKEQN